jgi:hypothetical protein
MDGLKPVIRGSVLSDIEEVYAAREIFITPILHKWTGAKFGTQSIALLLKNGNPFRASYAPITIIF